MFWDRLPCTSFECFLAQIIIIFISIVVFDLCSLYVNYKSFINIVTLIVTLIVIIISIIIIVIILCYSICVCAIIQCGARGL